MDQEKVYQLALFNTPLIGGFAFRSLIQFCGSARDVYTCSKKDLLTIPGIGEGIVNRITSGFDIEKAERDLVRAEEFGAEVIFYTDDNYPARLKATNDAPPVLFYRGTASLDPPRIISIVGTRKATDYGKRFVNELTEGLAEQNVTVVSGLAYGIDIEAHKASLKLGIPTIGAMASGLDKIYPYVHRKYVQQMLENGGIITEYGFNVQPEPAQFPARNRIIAGISDATIVVEAAEKGGALITAEFAQSYDREVFAVPGPVNSEMSMGCNKLIKNHKAHLLTCINDIIEVLNWDIQAKRESIARRASIELDSSEKKVFDVFKSATPFLVDEVSAKTEMDPSQLSNILLTLEFKGLIHSLPGKQYVRA